jgi:murein DD-endopeptidase MepM/ murein hydrolase activator NlpD
MPRVSFNIQRLVKLPFFANFLAYLRFLYRYIRLRGYKWFAKFESMKDVVVDLLYKQRGKYTRPFLHFGTIAMIFLVITFGPIILQQTKKEENGNSTTAVLNSAFAYGNDLSTNQSEEVQRFHGGEVTVHVVEDGETLSSVAQKYGLSNIETILWENNLPKDAKIKPGQELRILPIDGIRHKVARGETIFTIAKKYGLDENQAQAIIDYPFNEFKNDETFELTVGQTLMVPGGVKTEDLANGEQQAKFAAKLTPNAGSVTASGSFVWPAAGRITQGYSFYHKAFDIANHDGGPILAADSGTVIAAGWDTTGYGNKIMIDHGNGFITLYGHLSVMQVQVGQKVARGNVLGQMGSTGHSTGTHVHFEIRHGGVLENPGDYLK